MSINWSDPSAPAWAQAILSALAILVSSGLAILLAWRQRVIADKATLKEYRHASKRRVGAIGALMVSVYRVLDEARRAIYEAENDASKTMAIHQFLLVDLDLDRLRRASADLDRAPIHEMGSWSLVRQAIEMREIGVEALKVLAEEKAAASSASQNVRHVRIERLYNRANAAMGVIARYIAFYETEGPPLSEWKEFLAPPSNWDGKY